MSNLYVVKPNKAIRWPDFLRQPEGAQAKYPRGFAKWCRRNPIWRGQSGYVVDLDAPGELTMLEGQMGALEPWTGHGNKKADKVTWEPAQAYIASLSPGGGPVASEVEEAPEAEIEEEAAEELSQPLGGGSVYVAPKEDEVDE